MLGALRMGLQVGRLVLSLVLIPPYFEWMTWRAKSAFKEELLKNGLSRGIADNLADSYGKGNKNIVRSLFRPTGLTLSKRLGGNS